MADIKLLHHNDLEDDHRVDGSSGTAPATYAFSQLSGKIDIGAGRFARDFVAGHAV